MYDRADFAFASALASAWNAHCRTSGFVMTTYFNLTDVHKWDFGCNQEVCMWPANMMNNAQFGKAQTFLPGIGGFRSRSCWAMCNIPHYISSRKLKWWCVYCSSYFVKHEDIPYVWRPQRYNIVLLKKKVRKILDFRSSGRTLCLLMEVRIRRASSDNKSLISRVCGFKLLTLIVDCAHIEIRQRLFAPLTRYSGYDGHIS